MNTKVFFMFFGILLVLIPFSYSTSVSWWDSDWLKMRNITIDNSDNALLLANYQVNINVTFGNL